LRGLFVAGAQFRGDGLAALPRLELLDASSTAFDDEAAEALPALPRLTVLHLHGTQVTDASLPVLRRCRALETLSLPEGMSAESVRALREELPNCRIYWRGR
jgi:hypothetical protein